MPTNHSHIFLHLYFNDHFLMKLKLEGTETVIFKIFKTVSVSLLSLCFPGDVERSPAAQHWTRQSLPLSQWGRFQMEHWLWSGCPQWVEWAPPWLGDRLWRTSLYSEVSVKGWGSWSLHWSTCTTSWENTAEKPADRCFFSKTWWNIKESALTDPQYDEAVYQC